VEFSDCDGFGVGEGVDTGAGEVEGGGARAADTHTCRATSTSATGWRPRLDFSDCDGTGEGEGVDNGAVDIRDSRANSASATGWRPRVEFSDRDGFGEGKGVKNGAADTHAFKAASKSATVCLPGVKLHCPKAKSQEAACVTFKETFSFCSAYRLAKTSMELELPSFQHLCATNLTPFKSKVASDGSSEPSQVPV